MEIKIKNKEEDTPKTVLIEDIIKIVENSFDSYISVEGWIEADGSLFTDIDGYSLFLTAVEEEIKKLCEKSK
jgi:hypothetical protein